MDDRAGTRWGGCGGATVAHIHSLNAPSIVSRLKPARASSDCSKVSPASTSLRICISGIPPIRPARNNTA